MRLRFRSVKLLDLPSLDDNPFALFVTAHLAAQRASHDSAKRRTYKVRLFRELLESGCDSGTIKAFQILLDCLLALSARQDKLFWEELKATLPEAKMQYVTSFERRGRREGRQEGRQEAYCASILSFLQARFGEVPAELRNLVAGIQKSEKLASLVTLAGTVRSLEQFRRECDSE